MQMGKKKLHETINVQLFFTCFSILIDTYITFGGTIKVPLWNVDSLACAEGLTELPSVLYHISIPLFGHHPTQLTNSQQG